MFVSKAAVVGGGTMGGEIAQAIAAADIPVVVKDIDQQFVDAAVEKARAVTEGQLSRLVKKEKLTQEQADARLAEVMGLITGTTTYEAFGDVDFVVEAVPERMEIKQAVFRELDAATPGHAILASNTSSLSVTEMGETTLRPDKVVGFHFFYPASIMPLVEVIAGEDTSEETATVAYNFAQAIKKQPIVCGEVPGFVVNRILMATIGEIWRAQEEQGLSIKAIDGAIAGANLAPMGPFFLTDLLGLDTALHVAEHLAESYGESFYVHKGLQGLVADGKLGAKSGGEGFFRDGEQNIPGEAEPDTEEMVAMFTGRALIEACLLVEEGVCSVRDVDVGMMAGAGLDPRKGLLPPFWKADVEGLDTVLERIEQLQEKYGERFAPPALLRRLVAQGRYGMKSGQGFYPYPQPDEGEQAETVKLETRGEVAVAWLANAPMNAVSPDVIRDLKSVWEKVKATDGVGAMVIASSVPVVFSAGADIKAFTQLDVGGGVEVIYSALEMLRVFGQSR
ncbi:MAG: 3-hydroxyacyl-CoA dehydrogenase NAD-binding domain-containing protein, partial [Solirubrobacterales bacterium]